MAIIDVIKFDSSDRDFLWKFPSDDLRMGSQLVVRTSQTAFFVKGGMIYDEFNEGRYTLTSGNIPLLTTILSLPFGGVTPFQAEVWFVNRVTKLDNKWGTSTPIQLEDPTYKIIVPVRAYGQFGLRIENPRLFLQSIVGTMREFRTEKIVEYFNGILLSNIGSRLSARIIKEKVSVLEVNMYLKELSTVIQDDIASEFAQYGVGLVNFAFMSINFPEDDSSVMALKKAKETAATVKTIGKDIYQMQRSFDVLEKAAGNEGIAGTMVGTGLGLGMGLGVGAGVGNQMAGVGGMMNVNPAPPVIPPALSQYYVVIDGAQSGPFDQSQLTELAGSGKVVASTLVWKSGMNDWAPASGQSDLEPLFRLKPPPIPN